MKTSTHRKTDSYTTDFSDKALAFILMLPLLPVWITNVIIGIMKNRKAILTESKFDALGRNITLHRFSEGMLKNTLYLLDILAGHISICGTSINMTERRIKPGIARKITMAPGLISLYDIHRRIGISEINADELMIEQQNTFRGFGKLRLIAKGLVSYLLYSQSEYTTPSRFKLFGIRINNISLHDAVQWILSCKQLNTSYQPACHQPASQQPASHQPRIGFFVNVNSVNLTFDKPDFRKALARANKIFADGSGVRLAARHKKINIRANVNGTDLLPLLCQALANPAGGAKKQSVYLLGAEPGVAAECAKKLTQRFPGLNIAGTHHGYFDQQNCNHVINAINGSGADILLVAMGSPIQEEWLLQHRHSLNCHCALAVGGLLDFYAEKVSRAPLWLREIGLEWVWRLLQEPEKKWRRYLLGNPRFLFHTFIA